MTRADDDGRFSVLLENAGPHSVALGSQDLQLLGHSQLSLDIPPEGSEKTDLKFPAGTLSGRVIDGDGEPVVKARVELSSDVGESGPATDKEAKRSGSLRRFRPLRTAVDGAFEITGLAPGRYILVVNARGFAQREVGPVELGLDETHLLEEIVLDRELTLEVRALDPRGDTLGNQTIAALRGGDINRPLGTPGRVDHRLLAVDGSVAIKGLSEGVYGLVGLHPGLAPVIKDRVEFREDANDSPIELVFRQGGALEIQFLDGDGIPVEGCRLRMLDASGRDLAWIYEGLMAMSDPVFVSDSEGYVRLNAVQPGFLWFLPSA